MNLGVKSQVKGRHDQKYAFEHADLRHFSPFTFEANINLQMPELYFPAVAIHEYAHLQGFAREDEANFIAWYLGSQCGDADFVYSANAYALRYALNSLYGVWPEEYKKPTRCLITA